MFYKGKYYQILKLTTRNTMIYELVLSNKNLKFASGSRKKQINKKKNWNYCYLD